MELKAVAEAIKIGKSFKTHRTESISLLAKGKGFSAVNLVWTEMKGRTRTRAGVRGWLQSVLTRSLQMSAEEAMEFFDNGGFESEMQELVFTFQNGSGSATLHRIAYRQVGDGENYECIHRHTQGSFTLAPDIYLHSTCIQRYTKHKLNVTFLYVPRSLVMEDVLPLLETFPKLLLTSQPPIPNQQTIV